MLTIDFLKAIISPLVLVIGGLSLVAQSACDPSITPSDLQSNVKPGGVQLTWTPTPFSIGARLLAQTPQGVSVSKTIYGPEPAVYMVPEHVLEPGDYIWYVKSTCTLFPPYLTSSTSVADTFRYKSCGPVTDIEGHSYSSVVIGGDCWLRENLRVGRLRDGTPLNTVAVNADWESNEGLPSVGVYNNDSTNRILYGYLYNWAAVSDSRGLCPIGWHVPSDAEWMALATELGGLSIAGGALKDDEAWNGANNSFFNGLPGGRRANGYYGLGIDGYWWTSTVYYSSENYAYHLYDLTDQLYRITQPRFLGYSVRCVKD